MINETHDEVGPPGTGAEGDLDELFRLVVEASRDMIVIGRPDAEEWVSPAVTELLGFEPAEFLAMDTADLVHPDDRRGMARARSLVARGQGVGGRCRVRHRDGTYRWLEGRVRPLPDDDGGYSGRSISSWRVVDREVKVLARLRTSEERYRLLVENVGDGVALERDGILVWASPNLHDMLGWPPDEWLGRPLAELVHPDHRDEVERARRRSTRTDQLTVRLRVRAADGEVHWLEIHARPFIDANGDRDGTACSFRIVDAEVEAEAELQRRARYDQLTGLMNRKEIIDRLATLGADARRAGTESAVLFCDLDRFEVVNDTYGHAVGDLVLRAVAARVRSAVRAADIVGRIGGDELLVVLHHLHDVNEALAVADQIRRATSQPIAGPHGPVSVTVSIGVTMISPGDTSDDVIARADEAMYRAKEAGRDGVQRLPFEG